MQISATKITRIAWNDHNWTRPSHVCSEIEKGTYASENGFGHEEWLNRKEWTIRGYRYAFLQGVGSPRNKWGGKALRVLLYTIDPDRKRQIVGLLREAVVLNEEEAVEAVDVFRSKGWLRTMQREVRAVGGNTSELRKDAEENPIWFINIRFRPRDLEMYSKRDEISTLKNSRYLLLDLGDSQAAKLTRRSRRPINQKGIGMLKRAASKPSESRQDHNRLQNRVAKILKGKYGEKCVLLEKDFVDITVEIGDSRTLVEVKACSSARLAIREGLGQLLEYAYFQNSKAARPRLYLLGTSSMNVAEKMYLKQLNTKFNIGLKYITLHEAKSI